MYVFNISIPISSEIYELLKNFILHLVRNASRMRMIYCYIIYQRAFVNILIALFEYIEKNVLEIDHLLIFVFLHPNQKIPYHFRFKHS